MRKYIAFYIALLFVGINSVTAQINSVKPQPIHANTIKEGDSLAVKTVMLYGSTKKSSKLKISVLAYSKNGQEHLLTSSTVVVGEDIPLNGVLTNFPNGDGVIENAPIAGNTVKDYFSKDEKLYREYLKQRYKILERLK
ncbi:MAG: hypothetical protein ACLGH8_04335 [Bacteroidia bacterium]